MYLVIHNSVHSVIQKVENCCAIRAKFWKFDFWLYKIDYFDNNWHRQTGVKMAQWFSIFWITPLNCGWQNTKLVKFLAPTEQLCIRTPLIKLCYSLLCILSTPLCTLYLFTYYKTVAKMLWISQKPWTKMVRYFWFSFSKYLYFY